MMSTTSSRSGAENRAPRVPSLLRFCLPIVSTMVILLALSFSVGWRTSVVRAHDAEGMVATDMSQTDVSQSDVSQTDGSQTDNAHANHDNNSASMSLAGPWGTLPPPAGNAIALYEADLSPANEVDKPDNVSSGRAVFALISDTISNSVYLRLMVNDPGTIRVSHIHEAAMGVAGSPIVTLYDSTTDGVFDAAHPLTATVVLTDSEQISKLNNGGYYINFHTPDFKGTARGQIRPFTNVPTKFTAMLLGGNERPTPVTTTSAVGVAYLTLDPATGVISYELHVSTIVSITNAHIHRGGSEEAGKVVTGLNFVGLAPGNPTSGTVTLDGQALVDLLTGHLYVNVHTSANPGGEIRGQIGGASLFEACLTGADEVPAVTTNASGKAVIALDADGSKAFYRLMVSDIQNVTAGHIHGAPVGVNGAPIFDFLSGGVSLSPGNPVSGVVPMSPLVVLNLLAGNLYVNVHTPANPNGEIRGQIMPLSAPGHLNALMTQAEEVPPSGVSGVGLVRLTLSDLLDRVNFTVVVTGVEDITAAHIHRGPRGVNGSAFVDLFKPEVLSSTDPAGGGDALSAQEWVDLLTGYAYANVHTGPQVKSVIRGQVGGVHTYWSKLNGANEAPIPVTTTATGEAILAINNLLTVLDYRMFVASIPTINAAHIHRGAAGVAGPVVTGLFPGTGAFDAASPLSGTALLKTNDVLDLIAGKLYLNVHTSGNAGGEIRDQIRPYSAPSQFTALLTGAGEVPPVVTAASGLAYMRLDAEMGHLSYSAVVTNITDVRAAHIHYGPVGKNGPVTIGLYSSSTDGVFDATHPIGGCARVGSKQIVDLLTGYSYVNIHTAANPGGEIRGQVGALTRIYLPVVAKN